MLSISLLRRRDLSSVAHDHLLDNKMCQITITDLPSTITPQILPKHLSSGSLTLRLMMHQLAPKPKQVHRIHKMRPSGEKPRTKTRNFPCVQLTRHRSDNRDGKTDRSHQSLPAIIPKHLHRVHIISRVPHWSSPPRIMGTNHTPTRSKFHDLEIIQI